MKASMTDCAQGGSLKRSHPAIHTPQGRAWNVILRIYAAISPLTVLQEERYE